MSVSKRGQKIISYWVGSEQTYWIGARGSDQTEQIILEQEEWRVEFVITEISGRLARGEEARRGNILRRNREKGGGGYGYLGDSKYRKRGREMVI